MKGQKPIKPEPVELVFDDEPQGATLVPDAAPSAPTPSTSTPSAPAPSAKMKCAYCTSPVETGWLACPRCGANFGAPVPPRPLGAGYPAPNPQPITGPPTALSYSPPYASGAYQTPVPHSSTQLTRVLVAVVLLFIGVPGLISGSVMAFSSPGADSVAKQEAYNHAAGIAGDPIERDGNQRIAANDDGASHTVGGFLVLFSAALCVPGVVLLVGKKS